MFENLIKTISKSAIYCHDTANMHLCALLGLKTTRFFPREIKGKWFPID